MTAPVSSEPNLDGQLAVVTGAFGGIGKAVCQTLAAAGADIIGVDIPSQSSDSVKSEVATAGQEYHHIAQDLTEDQAAKRVLEEVKDKDRSADILVNAHGVIADDRNLSKVDIDRWDQIIETNLTSIYEISHHFLLHMMEAGYGKIVTIGSIAGRIGRSTPTVSYSASKGGVHAMTKQLALLGAEESVYVNSIAPGPVRTPLTGMADDFPDWTCPLGRIGEPEDIAQAVLFLSSQQSNWITGTVLDVNGGELMQ